MSGWQARVRRDFPHDKVTIAIIRDSFGGYGEQHQVLDATGTIHTVDRHAALPQEVQDALIQMPAEAWEALCELAAGESHLGAEVRVLREWLGVERDRTDRILREQQ